MKARLGLLAAVAAGLGAGAAGAATLTNATAYALGDDGSSLVTVASRTGDGRAVGITDGAGNAVSLDGIDFRPSTAMLYGYSDDTDTVYTVDVRSGVATAVASSAGFTNDATLDMDFNPQADAFRVVNSANENVVFNPNTGAFLTATTTPASNPLMFAAGDANAGQDPNVAFNAYTNSVFGMLATSQQQFTIDFGLDVLTTLNNNGGMLATVGGLTLGGVEFDATGEGGLDILSFMVGSDIANTAYALLTEGTTGVQALYEVSLFGPTAGALTLVGAVPAAYGTLDGLAVIPSPIPVPAAGLLLLGGLGALAGLRRRRPA